ncbi:MAG: POTRA domain-containing protein [Terracidiphilus sp.]
MLQDLGYYKARAEDPQVSVIGKEGEASYGDVSVRVEEGDRYYLGEITFPGASLFDPYELRRQFPIDRGSLLNTTAIGTGLDRLREMYADRGYPNFGAIPQPSFDIEHHIVAFTIDIDEGKAYRFGKLMLGGLEPFAGAGHALLTCWRLEGKQYNPQLLKNWLAKCTLDWPADAAKRSRAEDVEDNDSNVVNVRLEFP